MTIETSWERAREWLSEHAATGNLFYSKEFFDYTRKNRSTPVYLFEGDFCQIVTIHKIKGLFTCATFPTEPICFGKGSSFAAEQAFLNEVVAILKKTYRVDWTTVTAAGANFSAYPSASRRIAFGNYILDLRPDETALFAKVTSKHRNMIRRGEKAGIAVRFGGEELLDDYLQVDRATWRRSGKNTDDAEQYRSILRCFSDRALIGMAYLNGAPQCGLLGIFNSEMFYYMHGATADAPEPGATHALQWKTILRMKALGVKKYSFVGCRIRADEDSKYKRIQHFKEGFGGELVQGYAFKCVLRPWKKKLFDLLMKLKTGSVPVDAIDQEIGKWAEIN